MFPIVQAHFISLFIVGVVLNDAPTVVFFFHLHPSCSFIATAKLKLAAAQQQRMGCCSTPTYQSSIVLPNHDTVLLHTVAGMERERKML